MTIFVGVVSQKGGVGKSTIARSIAREYAANGWNVKISDLDISQGTSVDWKRRRDQEKLQPDIAVEASRTVALAIKNAEPYDMVIFDGPPHSTAGTLDIARHSDLVVLPTGLSQDDLKPSVLLAHALVDKGIPANKLAFALCRVGGRPNEILEARDYIQAAGYLPLAGELPEKTAFRRASDLGKTPTEISFPTLRQRAEVLIQSIVDAIAETQEQRKVA